MLHELREEISKMCETNTHFARLFDEHNALDQKIHKLEQGLEVDGLVVIDELKKEKLKLKDKIYQMLLEAKNA